MSIRVHSKFYENQMVKKVIYNRAQLEVSVDSLFVPSRVNAKFEYVFCRKKSWKAFMRIVGAKEVKGVGMANFSNELGKILYW